MSDDGDIKFPEIDHYDDEELNKIWRSIQDIFGEQGRVYNYEIKDRADELDTRYEKQTIISDILPKLRNALDEKNIISVELEDDRETQGPTRKVWILPTGENQ